MTEIFNQHEQLERRRVLRRASTMTEKIFWKYVRANQLGVRVRRQVGIGRYVVDFYVPNADWSLNSTVIVIWRSERKRGIVSGKKYRKVRSEGVEIYRL